MGDNSVLQQSQVSIHFIALRNTGLKRLKMNNPAVSSEVSGYSSKYS